MALHNHPASLPPTNPPIYHSSAKKPSTDFGLVNWQLSLPKILLGVG